MHLKEQTFINWNINFIDLLDLWPFYLLDLYLHCDVFFFLWKPCNIKIWWIDIRGQMQKVQSKGLALKQTWAFSSSYYQTCLYCKNTWCVPTVNLHPYLMCCWVVMRRSADGRLNRGHTLASCFWVCVRARLRSVSTNWCCCFPCLTNWLKPDEQPVFRATVRCVD